MSLIDLVGAFESATRAHENLGSQPLEDHAIIEEEFKSAKENLIGEVKERTNDPALAVKQAETPKLESAPVEVTSEPKEDFYRSSSVPVQSSDDSFSSLGSSSLGSPSLSSDSGWGSSDGGSSSGSDNW